MKKQILLFVPLLMFAALSVFFFEALKLRETRSNSELTSALIDRPFPEFALPGLDNRMHTRDDLVGEVRLVNVWGSWCPSCRDEHPFLEELTRRGVSIVGLNYKDTPDAAIQWLQVFGDIYDFHIQDQSGRLGLDLGVYGAPETFLIDRMGVIRYKRVGVVNETIWQEQIKPRYLAFGGLLNTPEAP